MTEDDLHTKVDLENGSPAFAKPVLVADADFSTNFQSVRNILKKVENKFGLYCFCIYICITIIK